MFIKLITSKGEKITARVKDVRLAKVEKLKSDYCCYFLIGREELYLEESFGTYKEAEDFIKNIFKKEALLCN
jgi:hypothetical protein